MLRGQRTFYQEHLLLATFFVLAGRDVIGKMSLVQNYELFGNDWKHFFGSKLSSLAEPPQQADFEILMTGR